jgi:type I restriction enzyme R subunit
MSWPRSKAALGRPATPQDVLMYGMLSPDNLLDLVRNFVVFERDPHSGKSIKKVPRYQQYFSGEQSGVARADGHGTGRARRRGLAHPRLGKEPDHAVAGAQAAE